MAIRHFRKYIGREIRDYEVRLCDDFVESILDAEVGGKFTFISGQLIQDESGFTYFCVFEQEPQVMRSVKAA